MKTIAARTSSFHRVLLVVSSVTLGVVGSRAASDPTEWSAWSLLLASGALLFVADVGRHVDEKARTVAVAARVSVGTARRDVASVAEARAIAFGMAVVLLSVVAAVIFATTLALRI